MSDINISDPLMQMIFSAVDEGLLALKAQQNFVPFALLLTKEGIIIKRFTNDDLSIAIDNAKQAIIKADEDTLGYALVYDVEFEIDDQTADALMIEAGERGKGDGWRFLQRYQAKRDDKQAQAIGDLAFLELHANYIG
ncbi:MAG: hypothetical protein WBC91_13970 [Phototrophicaceae bacterium]